MSETEIERKLSMKHTFLATNLKSVICEYETNFPRNFLFIYNLEKEKQNILLGNQFLLLLFITQL